MLVYLALGSNMGDSVALMNDAIDKIQSHPQIELVNTADFYRTAPMGYADQDDFINTAIAIKTDLAPHDLLDYTQSIENELGRTRSRERNGPRTIDIDIALYGNQSINSERLIIPHPRIAERRFVLQPLADLNPALEIPDVGDVTELLAATLTQIVEPLNFN